MRFLGFLTRKRAPEAAPPVPGGDSRAERFPWFDFTHGFPISRGLDPLMVAVRAILVIEYHVATALEQGEDGGMTLVGLTGTLQALSRGGDYHAVGDFLGALETIIPAWDRRHWPPALLSRDGPDVPAAFREGG